MSGYTSEEMDARCAYYLPAWREMAREEGAAVAAAHARRVVGGTAAGHWCDCAEDQKEAARRYLATR